MWIYEKKLEHPVNIQCKDLQMAKYLMTQFGGPDGELSAALRYLSQRYTMPTGKSNPLLSKTTYTKILVSNLIKFQRNITL